MSYKVEDSRRPDEPDGRFTSLTDALRFALADPTADIYMHDDRCDEKTVRRDCPCQPVLIRKARRG